MKDLKRHKDGSCEGSGGPPFQCKSCSKTCPSKDSLSSHLRKFCPSLKDPTNDVMEHDEVDVENEDDYEDGDEDDEHNNEDDRMGVDKDCEGHYDDGDSDEKHDNEDDEHLLQDLLDSDPGEV